MEVGSESLSSPHSGCTRICLVPTIAQHASRAIIDYSAAAGQFGSSSRRLGRRRSGCDVCCRGKQADCRDNAGHQIVATIAQSGLSDYRMF